MKKILLYALLAALSACGSGQKKVNAESVPLISDQKKKDTCFCDTVGNMNLISDGTMAMRRQLWRNKIKPLFKDTNNLPQGFRISIDDLNSLAELVNNKKNPTPKSVMAYFTFDTQSAADSGKVTAVFVPQYAQPFPPCTKGCKPGKDVTMGNNDANQTINVDLTRPCPPLCD